MERNNRERGKFIAFEGLDGCGKTTQIKRLAAHFSDAGIKYLLTAEPTGGLLGRLARNVLLEIVEMSAEALALLFAADRAEHVIRQILPALETGKHVLCDRFVYSNMAFQGTALPLAKIAAFNDTAISVRPDLTLFIDVQPEECRRRMLPVRQSEEIYDGIKISHKIRERYYEAFQAYGTTMPVAVIDGNVPENEVFTQILTAVEGLVK